MIYGNVFEMIGNTPLVKLNKTFSKKGVNVYLKLEKYNPGGSIKDRIALSMIEGAEKSGKLKKGMSLIEPTSGNTGIGLALIASLKGYEANLVMPETMSTERRKIIASYGAKIILSKGEEGIDGSIRLARKLAEENPGKYLMLNQYDNPDNYLAHYDNTAEEILEDLPGITHFVAGLGTSGTLVGIAKKLREAKPDVRIYAVEPLPGHKLQGLKNMGEAIVPKIYDPEIYDEKIAIGDEDAWRMARELARREGLFLGMSTGASASAALQVAKGIDVGNVVAIAPDGGEKYLSTELFG